MAYSYYNPNPVGRFVDDCTVRALSKVLNIDWETAHVLLDNAAIKMGDMSDSKSVLPAVLRQYCFYRDVIPNTCPDCYTAEDFCNDHQNGTYVISFGGHVAAVVDGVLYDTADTSNDTPYYFWYKKEEKK